MKIEDACPTCGALCEVDLDADEEEYVAIDVAVRATAEQRDSVIEQCAKCAETVMLESFASDSYIRQTQQNRKQISDAIRALKSQQDAAIEAEPAEQRAWQPIATAPKDGTRFIAWLKGRAEFMHWQDQGGATRPVGWRDNFIYVYEDGTGPSHWMPLPAPTDAAIESKPTLPNLKE